MNVDLLTVFQSHGGVATFAELQSAIPRRELRRLMRSGEITKAYPGVYGLRDPRVRTLLNALDLHCGEQVVACMATAAAVFGFDTESVTALHVLNPEGHQLRSRSGLVVHRREGAPLVTHHSKLVTEPAWTAVEVARALPRPRALATLDKALGSKTCDRAGLAAAATAQRGRRGIVVVRKLIPLASPLAESEMESEARLAMIDGDIPDPVLQHEIIDLDGKLWRVDFAWPGLLLAVEYDGFDAHKSPADLARDRRKDAALREAGWTVLHIVADDVRRYPDVMLRRIRRDLACAAA